MRKEEGGMGFRDLYFFNLAMLGKHGWNFVSNPHTLASRLIKAKYFRQGNFLSAQLGLNRALHGRVYGQRNPSLKWGAGGV